MKPGLHGLGGSQPLSYEMCQAIRRVLLGDAPLEPWSRRAATEMAQAREEATCVAADALVVETEHGRGRTTWLTFAGLLANSVLSGAFPEAGTQFDNLSITANRLLRPGDFRERLKSFVAVGSSRRDESCEMKFHECLPDHLCSQVQSARLSDPKAVKLTREASLIHRDAP